MWDSPSSRIVIESRAEGSKRDSGVLHWRGNAKFFCRIVISQSLLYRCARKISRFARNDDMGAPSTRRDERGCEIARPHESSSKAEPRDLNMIAAFCIGEETQSFFAVSLSHSLRFTGVQGRFLASLEMTIWGENDDMGE